MMSLNPQMVSPPLIPKTPPAMYRLQPQQKETLEETLAEKSRHWEDLDMYARNFEASGTESIHTSESNTSTLDPRIHLNPVNHVNPLSSESSLASATQMQMTKDSDPQCRLKGPYSLSNRPKSQIFGSDRQSFQAPTRASTVPEGGFQVPHQNSHTFPGRPEREGSRRHRVKRIIKPGRVWSMNSAQEIALKQFWAILLKSFGYEISLSQDEIESGTVLVASSKKPSARRRRERMSTDKTDGKISDATDSGGSSLQNERSETQSMTSESSFIFQFSYNRIKSVFYSLETGTLEADNTSNIFSLGGGSVHSTLSSFVGEDLHKSLWASCRNDNLDNYLLRLLREKEFNVNKALKMFATIFDWRLNTHGVEDLLCKGDAHFYFEGQHPSLVQMFMRNEIFTRGKARNGEPLIYVRAWKHLRSNCPAPEFEKFLILIYEWIRLQFSETRSGVDQCQLIFDLTGFTMKNADMHAIRFLVRCHEMYFPHFVGTIYMHNAPKVFWILWNVVVKWMNSRLREVIIFTNGYEQLHQRISSRYIPKSLGGKDNDVPPFIEPNLYNFQRKVPDERFGDLVRERDELTVNFIDATVKWIEASDPDESRVHLDSKIAIAAQKAQNYIELDPYLRSRGVPDRNGEIGTLYY